MNIRRILFWSGFVIILGLIVWGLIAAMNKPAPGSVVGTPVPVSSSDQILGSAEAPVTLIEYGDFQCPACAVYADLVDRLFLESSSTMNVVFRHFPLPQHANATISSRAAEAAGEQGKFWEMYRLIYGGQRQWENASDSAARQIFRGYAESLGLDLAKYETDLDSKAAGDKIAADLAEAQSLGLSYTPTFFVNGELIQNPSSYEQFKAIIDAAARPAD